MSFGVHSEVGKLRKVMVHRPAFGPSIRRESNRSLSAEKPGGGDVLKRRQGRLLELVGEVACVPLDVCHMFGRNWETENG